MFLRYTVFNIIFSLLFWSETIYFHCRSLPFRHVILDWLCDYMTEKSTIPAAGIQSIVSTPWHTLDKVMMGVIVISERKKQNNLTLSSLGKIFSRHFFFIFVLRFYGPVNPMGSCRARSVYLTKRLLGRLSPPAVNQYCAHSFARKQTTYLNIFPRKQDLEFHVNCLQWRKFA